MNQTEEIPAYVWEVVGFEAARLLHGWGVHGSDSLDPVTLYDPYAIAEAPPKNPLELAVRALNEGNSQPVPAEPAALYTRVARVCALSVLALATLPHPTELGLDSTIYDGLFDED